MTGEGSARVSALIDDVAGAVFDPNSIRCEVTAMVRPRVWADSDSWPARVDAKSPNPGFERLPGKAQPDCCSRGTGHSPLRGCQGGLDALSLVSWPCAGG